MVVHIRDKNENAYRERYGRSFSAMVENCGEYDNALFEEYLRKNDAYDVIPQEDGLLYILVGMPDGDFIKRFLGKIPKQARIVICEPSEELFLYLCSERDLSEVISDEKIEICLCAEPGEGIRKVLEQRIQHYNFSHMAMVVMPGHPYVDQRYLSGIREVAEEIGKELSAIERVCNFGDVRGFHQLYALSRLPENQTAEKFFAGIPTRDIPIILVAAGPSLAQNVQQLKRAMGKALIVVVSRAAAVVKKAGIEPDLIAVVDSTDATGYLDPDRSDQGYLLAAAEAALDDQRTFQGRCIYFSFPEEEFPLPFTGGINGEAASGGASVATSVCHLFLEAGFRHIVLVGQDLAYAADGSSHSGSKQEAEGSQILGETMGINGEIVKTRGDWLKYKQEFELLIEAYPESTVIDATEGGAYIQGSQVMTLGQAIDLYCTVSYEIGNWIRFNKAPVNEEETGMIRALLRRWQEESLRYRELLGKMIRLGTAVCLEAGKPDADTDTYSRLCADYDRCYHRVISEDDGEPVRYCNINVLLEYMEKAMQLEGRSTIGEKVEAELQMAGKLKDGADRLIDWLETLMSA